MRCLHFWVFVSAISFKIFTTNSTGSFTVVRTNNTFCIPLSITWNLLSDSFLSACAWSIVFSRSNSSSISFSISTSSPFDIDSTWKDRFYGHNIRKKLGGGGGDFKYMWLHGSRIVFVSCALTLGNTSSWPYIWSAYSFKILYASRIVSRSLLLQKSRKPLSPGHIANFRFLDCGWCHFPFDFLFFTFVSDILKTSNQRFYHNCWRGLYYYIWFKAKHRSN